MAAEWVGLVRTTAPKYFKGAEDLTIRDRLVLSMLQKRGRFRMNAGGGDRCIWDVMFDEAPVESFGDSGVVDFTRRDLYRQLSLDWRGYVTSDSMTEKERLMNSGNEAIIKRYDKIMPNLSNSLRNKFSAELYVDGNATNNQDRLHGLESFMASGTEVVADISGDPTDSYGGKNTTLGDETGSWSSDLGTPPNADLATDWPEGQGDAAYDYLAPKLANWGSTNWGTGQNTWVDNCERCIRRLILWLTVGGGRQAKPDVIAMASHMYADYLNKQSAKQQIIVPHKEAQDLGFGDTVNQEGVAIFADYDVAINTGYALNLDKMEVRSLNPSLFSTKGPEFDMRTQSYMFAAGFFGNLVFQPKFFGKVYPYATA